MVGLYTTELVDPNPLYSAVQDHVTERKAHLHCYSRLPLRQLLRHVSAQNATAWWISEHPSPQTVEPAQNVLLEHLLSRSLKEHDVVVVESLDWLVARNGETSILEMVQRLDSESRTIGYSVLFPIDPLSLSQRFWKRLRAIAPDYDLLSMHSVAETDEPSESTSEHDDLASDEAGEAHDIVPWSAFPASVLITPFSLGVCCSGNEWALTSPISSPPCQCKTLMQRMRCINQLNRR